MWRLLLIKPGSSGCGKRKSLNLLGWTQEEISDKLKELFPDGKGISRESVKVFLAENGNDHFLPISSELDKGHPPETIAQRFGLPKILVWAAKLKGLPDPEKMAELDIKTRPFSQPAEIRRCSPAALLITPLTLLWTPRYSLGLLLAYRGKNPR